MKYFVMSDIHGSISSLNMALAHYDSSQFDGIILLGDILYHGPRNDLPAGYAPKEVIARLNPLQHEIVACVRGNCDAEVDQMVLEFPIMNEWVLLEETTTVLLTHGHHMDEHVSINPDVKVVLSGHTHIPTADEKDGKFYCNPGSTSIPKGGYPASYGVLDDHGFEVFACETNESIVLTQW